MIADMPFEHIVYIPAVLLVGLTVGYIMGSRAARSDQDKRRRRAKR